MESAQQEAYPGGPTQIPLSLRIMVFHRQITVPLDRLADAYMAIGDFDIALQYLQEAVERLEEAANLASGDTKRSFEKDLSRFLRKLRETQKKSAERTPQEPQFWIAYRGDDSGGRIKVFPGGVRASAERLKFLMSQAARHQNGQVSNIYLAEDEAEALRMAPYQFP
jgi:tetratricopeptide (TPR) repeat protein